jgi:hypothetical protein
VVDGDLLAPELLSEEVEFDLRSPGKHIMRTVKIINMGRK